MSFITIITGLQFPEGPCFDNDGNLWFVEIKGGKICKWDGHILKRFDINGTPNGLAIGKPDGLIWFCDSGNSSIRTFDPVTLKTKTVCEVTTDGNRLMRPNDLIFDDRHNLIFSDHADGREKPVSTINVLMNAEKEANVISGNKYFTNGLALRNEGKELVFAETYAQKLWIGDWNSEKGELTGERVFANIGNGPWGPDGMAFDSYGRLYVAVFNENTVAVLSGDGDAVETLQTKGSRPTSCTFDPFGRYGLVVTEAELGEIIVKTVDDKGLEIY
jgi:gluconolactonase